MGRKKVSMVPIIDNKKRNIAFKQRKAGLVKKARELAILCDVNVSMFIFSDQQENNPEIFPPDDPHKLNDSIHLYERKLVSEPEKIKRYGLRDFFKDRKNKAEVELAKAKKRNLEAKYPTRFGFLDNSSEGELRNFAFRLEKNIDQVKRRIEFLRKVPKIENLDVEDSSCTQLWNPVTMMRPSGYNDFEFNHVGYCESSNPISMMDMLLKSEDENEYLYPMELYGDNQKILSMQSSNPNSILTSEGDSSCYDSENSGLPLMPLAMTQLEELPLMHMNSFLASSFPSHVLEYETSGYKYLA
ncbi:transcription factor, MADS-box [Artemisia annua]|uniref:Transcription factor, MADS-box n=1 Tax=Artemisia annua TaxID=35608 RepID=A0A2U1PLF5_ARTAN|nr:transcription factor, MADS-box [Artemisia annua]